MGKKHRPPTKTPTRDEQRQFAADKFKWLRQIALNPELPRIASQFAILLVTARRRTIFQGYAVSISTTSRPRLRSLSAHWVRHNSQWVALMFQHDQLHIHLTLSAMTELDRLEEFDHLDRIDRS